ncbi:MAG TPA: sugar kinase [Acidimicrobiales bacterium]|nr:sugar kinase [Acidimicrobiales bacterium]
MDVICIGMSVVDVLARGVTDVPHDGSTVFVERVSMSAGGDALNQAIILSRFGHAVSLMTLVGDDPQGRFLLGECAKSGVDVRGVTISRQFPTSTTVVLVGKDGERSCISQHGGTADEYGLSDIDIGLISRGVKVVSVGSFFCSEALDTDAVPVVLKAARDAGAVTVADFVQNRPDVTATDLVEVLPLLDYVAPSMSEAVQLTGKTLPDEAAEYLLDAGAHNVVIKLGPKGALARNRSERIAVPSYATDVVDTTGAGDNFMAGFIHGLLRDRPLADCLQFASATAALSVRALGTTGGVQGLADIEALLGRQPLEQALPEPSR